MFRTEKIAPHAVQVLKKTLRENGEWYKEILRVIEQKKTVRTPVVIDKEGRLACIHVVCHIDRILIGLANEFSRFPFGFPRGLAFLIDIEKEELLGTSAFYPKFDNDERNYEFSVRDFGNAEWMSAFIKYSGSLGKVLLYEHPDTHEIQWIVSSKNSGDYSDEGYPKRFHALLEPVLTKDRVQSLWNDGIRGFCGEFMLEDDQTHGYSYVKSGFVVTCMTTEDHFLSPTELYNMCKQHDLPTDKPIIFHGEKSIMDFITQLTYVRDYLTFDLLKVLLERNGIPLETRHHELIGSNILEGFVMRLSTGKSIKFKCWFYQMITQVLRPMCHGGVNRPTMMDNFSPFSIDYAFKTRVKQEMEKWVVAKDQRIQKFCRFIIHECAGNQNCVVQPSPIAPWIQMAEPIVQKYCTLLETHQYHIDDVMQDMGIPMSENTDTDTETEEDTITVPVVIVMGPIGYGKSTTARYLANVLHEKCVHIDGDDLGLGVEYAITGLKDRNLITVSVILDTIIQGYIPVVSTGGGAIWFDPHSKNKTHYLTNYLRASGIIPDYIFFVPSAELTWGTEIKTPLETIYDNKEEVMEIVKRRQETSEIGWTITDRDMERNQCKTKEQCALKIRGIVATVSKKNCDIVQAIIENGEDTKTIYTYPKVMPSSHHAIVALPPDIVKPITYPEHAHAHAHARIPIRAQAFYQMYRVCSTGVVLHRTLSYSSMVKDYERKPEGVPEGIINDAYTYVVYEKGSNKTCFVASFIKLPDDVRSHLTVDIQEYQPVSCGNLAEAIYTGADKAVLTAKNNSKVEITFEYTCTNTPVYAYPLIIPVIFRC